MSNHLNQKPLILLCLVLSACNTLSNKSPSVNSPLGNVEQNTALLFQIDSAISEKLTLDERKSIYQAEVKALDFGKSGKPVTWVGARKQVFGSITAFRPFRVGRSTCRSFIHNITISGKKTNGNGTACRVEQRPWKLIN